MNTGLSLFLAACVDHSRPLICHWTLFEEIYIYIYIPSSHFALRSNIIYLDYQSCDWYSRFPSKILYTFPFSLHLRYTTLFPNTLPVLEMSKIKSLTVSFRHSLFHEEDARSNNPHILYLLSLSQSSCSPMYSVLKAPSFHLLPLLCVRLSVKGKGEVEMTLYSFFSLGARWGGWLTPRPGRFSPEMAPFPVHGRPGLGGC